MKFLLFCKKEKRHQSLNTEMEYRQTQVRQKRKPMPKWQPHCFCKIRITLLPSTRPWPPASSCCKPQQPAWHRDAWVRNLMLAKNRWHYNRTPFLPEDTNNNGGWGCLLIFLPLLRIDIVAQNNSRYYKWNPYNKGEDAFIVTSATCGIVQHPQFLL